MTVGEAMLITTRIYVKPALEVLDKVKNVKALLHITGEGFRNLQRVRSEVGFILDFLPEPPPIFKLLQKEGDITDAEMANTYNMGVGLCAVVPESEAQAVMDVFRAHHIDSWVIGRAVADPERLVRIPALGLVGRHDKFYKE